MKAIFYKKIKKILAQIEHYTKTKPRIFSEVFNEKRRLPILPTVNRKYFRRKRA